MFLDLLAFFGTGVAAALLGQWLAADRVRNRWMVICVVVFCVGFEILALNVAFFSVWVELLCVLSGMAGLAMIICTLSTGRSASPPAPQARAGCFFALVVPFLPVVLFTIVGRVHHAQRMSERIEGMVSLKYRSHNHSVRSIAVAQDDGSTLTVEGVDEGVWDAVAPGRSRLKKLAWSALGELDGKDVRVVPKGYVIFLGPFRD
jgi:hypothetical protein